MIPEWPTEAQVKNLSSRIDTMYTETIFLHGRVKTDDDNIDRRIDKVTKMNMRGSNESERKLNAVNAATHHVMPDGKIVDLYELQAETNKRLLFMESVIKALDNKTKSLTISYGVLKMEASLSR